MCRLALFSNMKVKGAWLDDLTVSQGGDGNGFIFPAAGINPAIRMFQDGKLQSTTVDGLLVKKWYIPSRVYGRMLSLYTHKSINLQGFLAFHTRLASADVAAAENVHPVYAKGKKASVLLMQNGHEPEAVKRLMLYKRVEKLFDGTDYKSAAKLVAETGDPRLLLLTSSNWFVFINKHQGEGWELFVVSSKAHDPLVRVNFGDDKFYIASELLDTIHTGEKFLGIARFRVFGNKLEPVSEDIYERWPYVASKPKKSKKTNKLSKVCGDYDDSFVDDPYWYSDWKLYQREEEKKEGDEK